MPPSPWIPFATLAAAVIAAGTALLAGGLLTARSRLQRRLDKDVAIWDKMPSGRVKDALQARITRDAAELVVRTDGPRALRAPQVAAAVFFGIAAFNAANYTYAVANIPDLSAGLRTLLIVSGAGTTGAGCVFLVWSKDTLRRLVDDQMGAGERAVDPLAT